MIRNLVRAGAASMLLAAAPLLAQQDISLDETVTWAASAQVADPSNLPGMGLEAPTADDGGLVVLYRNVEYTISSETATRSSVIVYRYDGEEGIRDFGTLQLGYDAGSDQLTVTMAIVVDSTGAAHVVDPETVQIVPSDTFDVFSDSRIVMLPLQGLDAGSIAVIAQTTSTDLSKDIAPWSTILYEQYGIPQRKVEFSFAWDAPALRPQWNTELEGMQCTESSTSSLVCTVENVPAYPIESSVFYDDVTPQFIAGARQDWSQIASWYSAIVESSLSGTDSIEAKAAELSEGLDDETEILRSVHKFVSNQVRYVGLEHGDSAYVPHSTDVTLQRRFGDCKDKSALLIDLLRHNGIEMRPVLVSTTRRSPAKLAVPSPRYFDHLIVCGELSNGRSYCLDATDPYTSIDQLSQWIQGAVAFDVASGEGPTRLPAEDFGRSLRESLEMAIDETGTLREAGGIDYEAAYGSYLRSYLAGMTPSERIDWARQDYKQTVSSIVTPEFRFAGVDDPDEDLTVHWDANYDRMVASDDNLVFADDAAWLDQAISYLRTDNKHHAYQFIGLRFESVIEVTVAKHWDVVRWSPNIDMQSRFGRIQRFYEQKGDVLVMRTLFEAPAAEIGVTDLEAFDRFLETVMLEDEWRIEGALN